MPPSIRAWCARLCAVVGVTVAHPLAAQTCSPSHRETAAAMFAQVIEMGGKEQWISDWANALANGATVKQMVAANIHDPGYHARFVTGRPSRAIVADLYRHLLAREPDDGAWGWVAIGETQGWDVVIDGLMNSGEYMTKFGDHIVPGSPIVAWDCTRANFIAEAHQSSARDATQGAADVSYTTPAYTSLDQPRSATFLYSSGVARPTGLVRVNLVDNSGDAPNRASIRLQADGVWVSDEVSFNTGSGATQLSVQANASAYASGAYAVTAVVRKYWNSGRPMEEVLVSTRVLVINERGSPFGAGWMMVGLQRLRNQGDGVFITESGTGEWFSQLGCDPDGSCRYAPPPGDFSTVRWNAPAGVYERRYDNGSTVHFGANGLMLDFVDRYGNVTAYGYDGSARLNSITDPIGKVRTLGYTGAGALAWVEDPSGRRVTTTSLGAALYRFREPDNSLALDLSLAQDVTGAWILEKYWTAAGDSNLGDATGWQVTYDAHGRLASRTSPQVTTSDAGITRPTAVFRSLEAAVLAPPGTGSSSAPAPRVRPEAIRVEATDTRGNTARMAVDPAGSPVRMEEPLSRVTVLTRDRHGRVVAAVAPDGKRMRREFSGVDLRLTEEEATGSVLNAEYDAVYHQPVHVWGTAVEEAWSYYGASGQLDSTRVGPVTAKATRYTYTTFGRVASETDPEDHITSYRYGDQSAGNDVNPWGNLAAEEVGSTSTSLRRRVSMRYDRFGRDSLTISPGGDTTRTEYDLLDHPTRRVDALGRATQYEYDRHGLPTRITDPLNQVHVFNHNLVGWLESEVDPRGGVRTYSYDRLGNVTGHANRRQQSGSMTYDALNRPLLRIMGTDTTRWSYDPAGRWWEITNAEGTNRIELNATGTPYRAVTTLGGRVYTLEAAVDNRGRRTGLTALGPWAGAKTIGLRYNALAQLDTLIDLAGGRTTFAYDEDGLEISRVLPTGLVVSQGHISIHSPTGVQYLNSAVQEQFGFSYNINANGWMGGRIRRWRDAQGTTTGTIARSYGYDRVGQLTSHGDRITLDGQPSCPPQPDRTREEGACIPNGGLLAAGASYAYDAAGNRSGAGIVVESGNRLVASGGITMQYDGDGNLIRKTSSGLDRILTWNVLGQLTSVSTNGVTVSYGYDGLGRRVRRTGPDGVTYQLYDGDDLFMELDSLGIPVREYTYLPGVDRPHSVRVSGGAQYYYTTEHPGNVVGLIDANNQPVNRYDYLPWGQAEGVTEAISQPLRFMARELDEATGLYYVRARWYDPAVGRFISEDPLGVAAGTNVYSYVANNPTTYLDPSGLKQKCIDFYLITIDRRTGRVLSEEYQYTRCEGPGGSTGGTRSPSENKQCPIPPPLPPGESVDRNISVSEAARPYHRPDPDLFSQIMDTAADALWFYNRVADKKPWDYKNISGTYDERWENGGNFNYGATGRAIGFSQRTLLGMGGVAQQLGKHGNLGRGIPFISGSNGDEPIDGGWIRQGFRYYEQGCNQ